MGDLSKIESADRLIRRGELAEMLGLEPKTITEYVREKRIPPYDVVLSVRSKWWRESTLRKCGILSA